MALLMQAERAHETVRFLREEYEIAANIEPTHDHVVAWTPYPCGPTVYLTSRDAARVPA